MVNTLLNMCQRVLNCLVCCAVHTMNELKMTGNSLLGSRPLLSFDPVSSSVYVYVHYDVMYDVEANAVTSSC